MSDELQAIQSHVDNHLDPKVVGNRLITGIIGDRPSQYAKSPSIWNPTFEALGMEAIYLPFDVTGEHLEGLVGALRASDRYLGGSVAVPHKIAIMDYLDKVDEKSQQIGAVNAIVRTADGRLIGYNTDGKGGIDAITKVQPGYSEPFVQTPEGLDVLMIGAGGAARALAFYLAEAIGSGRLVIANRTFEKARSLADAVNQAYGNVEAVEETQIGKVAPTVGLIVNCTIKGQGGIRRLPDGRITVMEPYSALAPANPVVFPEEEHGVGTAFYQAWFEASIADIEANNAASARLALSLPIEVRFFDIVYAPLETAFLRHGRLTGHKTINGKGMNVGQAVDAMFDKVCRGYFESHGIHNEKTYKRILGVMYEVW
jgi:shikimate dehydrogenase